MVCACLCLPDSSSTRSYWGREVRLGEGQADCKSGGEEGGREEGRKGGREGGGKKGGGKRGRELGRGGMTTIKSLFGSQNPKDSIHTPCPLTDPFLITFPSAAAASGRGVV